MWMATAIEPAPSRWPLIKPARWRAQRPTDLRSAGSDTTDHLRNAELSSCQAQPDRSRHSAPTAETLWVRDNRRPKARMETTCRVQRTQGSRQGCLCKTTHLALSHTHPVEACTFLDIHRLRFQSTRILPHFRTAVVLKWGHKRALRSPHDREIRVHPVQEHESCTVTGSWFYRRRMPAIPRCMGQEDTVDPPSGNAPTEKRSSPHLPECRFALEGNSAASCIALALPPLCHQSPSQPA